MKTEKTMSYVFEFPNGDVVEIPAPLESDGWRKTAECVYNEVNRFVGHGSVEIVAPTIIHEGGLIVWKEYCARAFAECARVVSATVYEREIPKPVVEESPRYENPFPLLSGDFQGEELAKTDRAMGLLVKFKEMIRDSTACTPPDRIYGFTGQYCVFNASGGSVPALHEQDAIDAFKREMSDYPGRLKVVCYDDGYVKFFPAKAPEDSVPLFTYIAGNSTREKSPGKASGGPLIEEPADNVVSDFRKYKDVNYLVHPNRFIKEADIKEAIDEFHAERIDPDTELEALSCDGKNGIPMGEVHILPLGAFNIDEPIFVWRKKYRKVRPTSKVGH